MGARRTLLIAAVPFSLTFVLAFILIAPVVPYPNGGTLSQYESISYAYGGWGAVFSPGGSLVSISGWACSCPSEAPGRSVPCCVPPFATIIWPILGLMTAADIVTLATIAVRSRPGSRPRT